MARLLSPRATWAVMRAGDLRARLRAVRDGQAALRLHLTAAALTTGLVDALADGPRTTTELVDALDAADPYLLEAWLRTTVAAGLLLQDGDRWSLSRSGRALQGTTSPAPRTRRSRASTPASTASSAPCCRAAPAGTT